MALTPPAPVARRAGLLALAGVAVTTLAACDASVPNRLDFSDTEKVKITEILIADGSGDVTVKTSAIAETRIKRVVRYHGDEPTRSYWLDGTVLHVATGCGNNCSVSYDIEAPTGVAVRGQVASGDVNLTGVGATDIQLSSGTVRVQGATGEVRVEASSGEIAVADLAGPARLVATSGNITGHGLGRAPVNAEVSSGDVDLELAQPGSVTARATSGDVSLRVPDGRYQVRTSADSGDERISVPNTAGAPAVLDVTVDSGDIDVIRR